MFPRIKTQVIIMALLAASIGLSDQLAYSAWWDNPGVPVPENTQEVKRDKRKIMGMEFAFIFYESTQEREAIKDFYRIKLAGSGWTERKMDEQMAQLPNLPENPNLTRFLEGVLTFDKKDQQLIISILPAGVAPDNKTRFTLSLGEVSTSASNLAQQDTESSLPQLMAKPKRNIAPVYPQAALLSLAEQQEFSQMTYASSDDIEPILSFYKDKMAGYGWTLVNEAPIEKSNSAGLSEEAKNIYCPSCEDQIQPAADMTMYTGLLEFTNQRQSTCKISVSTVEGLKKLTTILVRYDEKKK